MSEFTTSGSVQMPTIEEHLPVQDFRFRKEIQGTYNWQ
jgi:hypothetical protein